MLPWQSSQQSSKPASVKYPSWGLGKKGREGWKGTITESLMSEWKGMRKNALWKCGQARCKWSVEGGGKEGTPPVSSHAAATIATSTRNCISHGCTLEIQPGQMRAEQVARRRVQGNSSSRTATNHDHIWPKCNQARCESSRWRWSSLLPPCTIIFAPGLQDSGLLQKPSQWSGRCENV